MSSVIEDTQSCGSASLSLLQRISYGSLDVAGNLLYCFGSTYILYFYTDVAGISLAVAGVILLLARIVDGIDAPIWGIIIDKTRSRYGKCRPLVLMAAAAFWCIQRAVILVSRYQHDRKSHICSNILHDCQHFIYRTQYTAQRNITSNDSVP